MMNFTSRQLQVSYTGVFLLAKRHHVQHSTIHSAENTVEKYTAQRTYICMFVLSICSGYHM